MLAVFAVGQVVWSMLWFFIFIIWIMLVFRIFGDIFRSDDLGGAAKVFWTLFVILLPYLGVFAYLIARGGKMAEREHRGAVQQEEAMRSYIRETAGPTGVASELERLASLRDKGVIDDNEFATLKAKALS
jgi:hypothetical protein